MQKIHVGYVTANDTIDVVFDDAGLGWVSLTSEGGDTNNLSVQQAEEIGVFFATAAAMAKYGIGANPQ